MIKRDTLFGKWPIFFPLLLVFSFTQAQIRLAAVAGIHSARVLENNNIPGWDTAYGNYYRPITGFQIGVLGEIPIGHKGFYLQPGMNFATKGRQYAKYNDSLSALASDTVFTQSKLSLSYIELPLYITYKIPLSADKKNNFLLSAGPYFAFFFNGNLNLQARVESTNKFSEQNIDLATGNSPGQYKSFDFGIDIRAGFELGSVLLTGYYSQGLTNFYTAPYESSFHHQLIGASLGIWLNKPAPPPPVAEKDSDYDGIPDKSDACPSQPGSAKWKGCPVPDTDKDGLNDEEDSCRTIPGKAAYHGCPVPDSDGDGINDEEDSCRNTPGPPRYHGCPIPDQDKDGVNDEEDRCPTQPGDPGNGGCPLIKKEMVEKLNYVARNVMFASSSSRLTASSYPGLDELAGILQQNPALRLTIEGYTDNTGNENANQRLSQARADAVKEYLVNKGISASRIKSLGLGSQKPVADNQSEQGKYLNRRVEFRLEQ